MIEPADQPLSLHPLGHRASGAAASVLDAARQVPLLGTHVAATVDWAVESGRRTPLPGSGRTHGAWEVLASTAALDVTAARVLEPHLDALAILAQARDDGLSVTAALSAVGAGDDSSWGVFAAEGTRLEARRSGDGWVLTGRKQWCSLAAVVSHALVTAWTGPDTRRLFAVSLRNEGVTCHRGPWVARGLNKVVSAPVDFADVPAVSIGDDGWYYTRSGFAWGGMGVAAVWWGATAPLVRAVVARAARDDADQIAAMHAGEVDSAFWTVRALLTEAATLVDAGIASRDLAITAERARSVTATHAERILTLADHALGPAPLTIDERHARRVADLRIYLRQHHAERDFTRLGRLLATS
ncbi:acyl-CoA dehydrogenase [Microbacterium awajiense]|uniref:Acyl-CoA dehydrogenase n=1 Tax=Microbacterium awajiense TaxID=415214 RepID=A0ABP7AW29_9MICO